MKNVFVWSLLLMVIGSVLMNSAVAEPSVVMQPSPMASGNSTSNGTASWSAFWTNLYTWLIIIPAGFLMAIPWLLYVVNRVKAEHEEDPQAQYKAKRWLTLAIEVDIILALVTSGVLFAWFHALANP